MDEENKVLKEEKDQKSRNRVFFLLVALSLALLGILLYEIITLLIH